MEIKTKHTHTHTRCSHVSSETLGKILQLYMKEEVEEKNNNSNQGIGKSSWKLKYARKN